MLPKRFLKQCPESSTKKYLTSYLQTIAPHCHQLNIISKVEADVQNVSGELIVPGLDSAASLIQAAKNLINDVVLTDKASYVASTKYPKQAAASGLNLTPIVVWKMKVLEKKALVRRDGPEEIRAKSAQVEVVFIDIIHNELEQTKIKRCSNTEEELSS
ncbi:CTNNA [Lepeophtheirus salmonis]|uniref:CTNNA n=1 Tax=Lepeophtheirus salmonis TaxID=72036 RepID=A0A7R8CIT2_LEPSM|nr:CTNNA [Lepeophtheirus salmonis]CAF2836328.1 CTNNA [Lepeophtheirus salmonis]